MELSLIIFLIICAAWAALLYYIFIIKKAPDLGAGGRSGIVVFTFVLIPFLAIVLWSQSGSDDRLAELGITPYPGFVSSVGVATGTGTNPTWIYEVTEEEGTLLDFYKNPDNHQGWTIVSGSGMGIALERGAKKLTIQVNGDKVFFTLYRE